MTTEKKLPLAGVRIADFSRVVAGPYGTYLLARLGADVIRVEGYGPLDTTRQVGPYGDDTRSINRGGYFNSVNGGKRSVSLHLGIAAHADLARQIALSSDIVVQSFRTGGADRLGIGYGTLSAQKPSLVYVSCSGFGQTGEMRSYSAYMNTVAAYVGLTGLTGVEGPQQMPLGATFSDLVTGTSIALTAMLGYRRARKTGRGRHIDVSMAEATMSLMGQPFMAYFADGTLPQRLGNGYTGHCPANVYACRGDDKWAAIAVTSQQHWAALATAIGRTEWAADPRFGSAPDRREALKEIEATISAWTSQLDNIEVAERLQSVGVPAVPSSDPEDLCRNPHFLQRGAVANQISTIEPPHLAPNLPWHFASQPQLADEVPMAPMIGQHTREVLEACTDASEALIRELEDAAAAAARAPGRGGAPTLSTNEDGG